MTSSRRASMIVVGATATIASIAAWAMTKERIRPDAPPYQQKTPKATRSTALAQGETIRTQTDRAPSTELDSPRAASHRLHCRIANHHNGTIVPGIEVQFTPITSPDCDPTHGITDDKGIVTVGVEHAGFYTPSITTYGRILMRPAEGIRAHEASAPHGGEPEVLEVIDLYAAAIETVGPAPFDGAFEWDQPLRYINAILLDIAGLQRNTHMAHERHGRWTQVYALSQLPPPTRVVALFFEQRGVVTAQVSMAKLREYQPTPVQVEGLPATGGTSGHVRVNVLDATGARFGVGPFGLQRSEPYHGWLGCRLSSEVARPVPTGKYTLTGGSLPLPWLFPTIATSTATNLEVTNGDTTEVRIQSEFQLRQVEVTMDVAGRSHALVLGSRAGSLLYRWGSVTFCDSHNKLQTALPVGHAAWRSYLGPNRFGPVIEFHIPAGAGVYKATLMRR